MNPGAELFVPEFSKDTQSYELYLDALFTQQREEAEEFYEQLQKEGIVQA